MILEVVFIRVGIIQRQWIVDNGSQLGSAFIVYTGRVVNGNINSANYTLSYKHSREKLVVLPLTAILNLS